MKIPFAKPKYWGNERQYLTDAFDSTWISEGEFNGRLEDSFAKEFQSDHVLLTSNGTSALELALQTIGIRENDAVICPGFCFQAGANVVKQLGAIPVFADVDLNTWNISPLEIEQKIYTNTKAIVVVHNYGYPCDMTKIMAIANHYKISVIEDCAEAIFTKYNSQYVGTFGDFGTFSFHATKTFTTGEGGMLICKLDSDATIAELIRSHGLLERGIYSHLLPGNNFRMSNLQAAIGYGQFEHKDEIVFRKLQIIDRYYSNLVEEPGIIVNGSYNPDHVLWSFPVRLDKNYFVRGRDSVKYELKQKGIETRPGFTPANLLSYFTTGSLPNSEILGKSILVLPSYLSITDEEIDYVCQNLLSLRSL